MDPLNIIERESAAYKDKRGGYVVKAAQISYVLSTPKYTEFPLEVKTGK